LLNPEFHHEVALLTNHLISIIRTQAPSFPQHNEKRESVSRVTSRKKTFPINEPLATISEAGCGDLASFLPKARQPHPARVDISVRLVKKGREDVFLPYALHASNILNHTMPYTITSDCVGCGACAKKCPESAITGERKQQHHIDTLFCTECGTCFKTCPRGAILDPDGNPPPKKGSKTKKIAHIEASICAACRTCMLNCPREAIIMKKRGFITSGSCRVIAENCVGCGECKKLCIMNAITIIDQYPEPES